LDDFSSPLTRLPGATAAVPSCYAVVLSTATCPRWQKHNQRLAALERRVAEREATVRDLTARLTTS
jgi:hypothetical protein